MSPEQARGTAAGFHSDQFSFGLILYEMVTGRAAFRRETPAATLDAIINDEPPMSGLDTRTPLQLRWIVERCLAKDPDELWISTLSGKNGAHAARSLAVGASWSFGGGFSGFGDVD
jgi:serine/threonine protein kinase